MKNMINYSELTPEKAASGCFVLDMPNDEYHKYPAISKSGLDKFAISPADYKNPKAHTPSRAMVVGTALHCAILEPERFKKDYTLLLEVEDRRKPEYRKAKEAFGEEFVLVKNEVENIAAMQKSAHNEAEIRELISGDYWTEVSAFATDPETGLLIKCRFDLMRKDGTIADLKKTRDARADKFAKSVAEYNYHIQDAFYSHVYELIAGEPPKAFKFIAIKEEKPHTARVYWMDDEAKQIGQYYYRRRLKSFAECYDADFWPHPSENGEISLPGWAIYNFESDVEGDIT